MITFVKWWSFELKLIFIFVIFAWGGGSGPWQARNVVRFILGRALDGGRRLGWRLWRSFSVNHLRRRRRRRKFARADHLWDDGRQATIDNRRLSRRPPNVLSGASALRPLYARSSSALCPFYVRYSHALGLCPLSFRSMLALRLLYVRSSSALCSLFVYSRPMSALLRLYARSLSALRSLYVRSSSVLHNKNETPILGDAIPVLGVKAKRGWFAFW